MTFKQFLENEGVVGIDESFSSVMDEVAAPLITLAYGIPGPAPAGAALSSTSIITAVPQALAMKQGVDQSHAAGASILMTALSTDIDTQVCSTLNAGAIALASPPFVGIPGIAVSPIALAIPPSSLNVAMCRALLKWAVSLLPQVDLRITSPFIT